MLKRFGGFAFVLFLASAPAALAGTMIVDGTLPRNLDDPYVNLDITISNISNDQVTKGNKDPTDLTAQLEKRFKIIAKDFDSTNEVFFDQSKVTDTQPLYVQERQAYEVLTDNTGTTATTKMVYHLQIREGRGGVIKAKASVSNPPKLTFDIYFYLGGKEDGGNKVAELTGKIIEQSIYVVTEAPTFAGDTPIVGSHKRLRTFFTVKDTVAVEPVTLGVKPPSYVNVYVVDLAIVTSTLDLPAKKFEPAVVAGDSAATCKFTAPAGGGGACVSCDDKVYLDDVQIAKGEISGVSMQQVAYKQGEASVLGLTNDRRYAVFLQYEPDGLKTSECLVGVPSPNFSLTELNGEGEASVVDFRCFIATAAYGSPFDQRVTIFRNFRDQVLKASAPGRWFVDTYYDLSPPVARYIADHPWLQRWTRGVLEVPAGVLRFFGFDQGPKA